MFSQIMVNWIKGFNVGTGKIVDFDVPLIGLEEYNNQITLTKHYNGGDFNITIDVNINTQDIELNQLINTYSLIPGQAYSFYIHFIKDTGEQTNGYIIEKDKLIPYSLTENTVSSNIEINTTKAIYPTFTFNNNLPIGYIGCFISIVHTKNKICELFNLTTDGLNDINGDCLEFDTKLIVPTKNVTIVNNNNDTLAFGNYYSSFTTELFNYFGKCGKVKISKNLNSNFRYFVENYYEVNEEDLKLKQCTPIISFNVINNIPFIYDNYNGLNLCGYVCFIKKLNFNGYYYLSTTDAYIKHTGIAGGDWKFEEVENEHKLQVFTPRNSPDAIIYSNYNLNYLSFSVEPKDTLVSASNGKVFTRVVLSQESSNIYQLSKMYFEYISKRYIPYNKNSVTNFTNVIRSSQLESDESKVIIYRFNSTDYYNVPTDKGKIMNLVSAGNAVIVHTEDSIYKFNGANSLSAQGGEDVAMKESEIFDTGIQEIFGSEFGFAGIQNREQYILSEKAYTFYDSDSKIIYMYTGQSGVTPISDPIHKLLTRDKVKDVRFANDFYNDRLFISILFNDNKKVNLSYNYLSNSFISLHDFYFDNSFNTKTNCYFVKNNYIYEVNNTINNDINCYSDLYFEDSLYPAKIVNDKPVSIIDIIYNENYNNIKVLNFITWVCGKIEEFSKYDKYNPSVPDLYRKFNMVAEEYITKYAGDYLRV